MSKGKKCSQSLNRQEASVFLAELAAAVENKEVELQGDKIAWDSIRKLKCSFYPSDDDLNLKVTVEQIRPKNESRNLLKKKRQKKCSKKF